MSGYTAGRRAALDAVAVDMRSLQDERDILAWLHAEALHNLARERSSRQAWAAEALGHTLDLERHYDLLHAIWLYVDWRKVTRQVTTEQKELWADAVEAFSEILHPGDPAEADRWWRDPGSTRPVCAVHPTKCRWWEGSPARQCAEPVEAGADFCAPHGERFARFVPFASIEIETPPGTPCAERGDAVLLAGAEARVAADNGERYSLEEVAAEFGVDLGAEGGEPK